MKWLKRLFAPTTKNQPSTGAKRPTPPTSASTTAQEPKATTNATPSISKRSSQSLFEEARSLLTKGEFNLMTFFDALLLLNEALEMDAKNLDAYLLRSALHIRAFEAMTNKPGEFNPDGGPDLLRVAREDSEKAIEIDARSPLAWYEKGVACHIAASFYKHMSNAGPPESARNAISDMSTDERRKFIGDFAAKRVVLQDRAKSEMMAATVALNRFLELAPGTKWESDVPSARKLLSELI